MNSLSKVTAFALLGLSTQAALSQPAANEAREDNWYQIHMAVFGHRSEAGDNEEVWRNALQLKYPRDLIRLKTRDHYLADLCGLNDPEPAVSAEGENRLMEILERVDAGEGYAPDDDAEPPATGEERELDPVCRELRPDLFPPSEDDIANARAQAVVTEAETLVSGSKSNDAKSAATPTPYVLSQTITDEKFAQLVKKLKGAYRYRLLFSGSWPQQLKSRSEAPALLIEGGDAVGKHHELEGYVRIGLERYLHIDTDLWLSEFSAERRSFRVYSDAPRASNDYVTARETPAAISARRRTEFPALPIPFPLNDPGFVEKAVTEDVSQPEFSEDTYPEQGADQFGDSLERSAQKPSEFRPRSNLDVLSAEDSSYYVDRTVVMRQNRRMRSDEVHYLDHPLFGLLIKISPVEQPDAESDEALNQR